MAQVLLSSTRTTFRAARTAGRFELVKERKSKEIVAKQLPEIERSTLRSVLHYFLFLETLTSML